jgi:hypothetical protein
MRILCTGQVEDETKIKLEIAKQTIVPDIVEFYIDDKPATGIDERRKRIADNHKKVQDIVKKHKPDLVWQVEQDCVLEANALELLLKTYLSVQNHDQIGYISGVQVGRHGLYCLGAWVDITKTSFRSFDYKKKGVYKVEGTGFYCLLANVKTWLKGKADWNGEPYGPDVVYGQSLIKQGYNIYINTDVKVGHRVKRGIIHPDHASTCNARFYLDNGKWKFKQL